MNDFSHTNQHSRPLTNNRTNDINNRNAAGLKNVFEVYWLLYIDKNIIDNTDYLYYRIDNNNDDMWTGIA